jgi:hypothetical protein
MPFPRSLPRALPRALAVVALAAGVWSVATAPVLAADARCSSSAVRVISTTPVATAVEPVRANAGQAPCSAQSARALSPTTAGPAELQAASAVTDLAAGPTLGASARVADPVVSLPGVTVRAEALDASVIARCLDGRTTTQGMSHVAALTVNGDAVTLPDGDAPATIDLGPVGTLRLNETVDDHGVLTRRALALDTLGSTIVLAEASAGGDACAAATAPSSGATGGAGGICPAGATYVADRNVCVIASHSSGNATGHDVVVGAPFEGPSGGRVMELATARAREPGASCLNGPGPRYAVLGTNGRDLITGTNGPDRVLLLAGADRVSTGRGNDCVDGGPGRDVIAGAQGADTLAGGTGNDALDGGSDSDRLSGGRGNDTINAGYGRDRVDAGPGNDAVNTAVAGPAARRIACGSGRDKARVNTNERRRVRGCEHVYRLR